MRFTCPYLRCVAGGEAMLHDRWCGTPVHQGRNTPTLLQTLLEPQDGFGQEKLQAGGLALSRLGMDWGVQGLPLVGVLL